jgi:hypothetical protein
MGRLWLRNLRNPLGARGGHADESFHDLLLSRAQGLLNDVGSPSGVASPVEDKAATVALAVILAQEMEVVSSVRVHESILVDATVYYNFLSSPPSPLLSHLWRLTRPPGCRWRRSSCPVRTLWRSRRWG